MLFAAGTRGRPGIVMISPQIAATNSAPARQPYLAYRHDVVGGRSFDICIGCKAVLGLLLAHR
jgi:hypothetical protein